MRCTEQVERFLTAQCRRVAVLRETPPVSLECAAAAFSFAQNGFGQVWAKQPIEFALHLQEFLSARLRVIIRLREFPHTTQQLHDPSALFDHTPIFDQRGVGP
jgi:hypothetical protein